MSAYRNDACAAVNAFVYVCQGVKATCYVCACTDKCVHATVHVSLQVHQYDIVMDVTVINRTNETLQNLCLELATMGDLKLVERPQNYTLAPGDSKVIRANIKVCWRVCVGVRAGGQKKLHTDSADWEHAGHGFCRATCVEILRSLRRSYCKRAP